MNIVCVLVHVRLCGNMCPCSFMWSYRQLSDYTATSFRWICDAVVRITANSGWVANAGSMLGQRLRRWPNIEPALAEHVNDVFAGTFFSIDSVKQLICQALYPDSPWYITHLLQIITPNLLLIKSGFSLMKLSYVEYSPPNQESSKSPYNWTPIRFDTNFLPVNKLCKVSD